MKNLSLKRCLKCDNAAASGRRICWKCHKAEWREKHPLRAMFLKVKWSAKLRDIPFKLTFDEFLEFDAVTDYVARRTLAGEDITIDRVNEEKGYEKENLQVLTRGENAAKSNHFRATTAWNRKLRTRRAA
jgi:hypothetical protein